MTDDLEHRLRRELPRATLPRAPERLRARLQAIAASEPGTPAAQGTGRRATTLRLVLGLAAVIVIGAGMISVTLTGRPTTPATDDGLTTTLGLWDPNNRVVFRAQFQPGEDRKFKWRAGTYAEYTRFGWRWGEPHTISPIAARDILPDPLGEPGKAVGRREVKFRVTADAFREPTIVGPNVLQWVDRPTREISVGGGRYFTSVESTESSAMYNVSAMIPVLIDVQGGITEARLRQAGTDYPGDLYAVYTALPKDALGPQATKLLTAMRATVAPPAGVDPSNPYDLARAMESYLRNPDRFAYDSDVRDERNAQCGDVSSVECFAIIKRGYCEYYASAMTVLLRQSGVPARVAYGFLPGVRGTDNLEVVNAQGAYWWVEVYFPGTGWVEFDPTGQVGQPLPIPSGSVGPPTP
jgi:transglutaminase-like putative cysteine protease